AGFRRAAEVLLPLPGADFSLLNGELEERFDPRFIAAAARVPSSGRISLPVLEDTLEPSFSARRAGSLSPRSSEVVGAHSCSACSQCRRSLPSGRPSFSQSSYARREIASAPDAETVKSVDEFCFMTKSPYTRLSYA